MKNMQITTSRYFKACLSMVAVVLFATNLHATLTINATWITDPGTEVKNTWASVATYYQNSFSNSFSGETWNITLDWQPLSGGTIALGGPSGNSTLGSVLKAQPGALTSRIQDNVYYASSLANHLAKATLVEGPNMSVTFSSNVTWDYSTSSKAADKESFYATAIHEIAHGLGFISADMPAGGWSDGKPLIFDYYLGLGSSSPTSLIGMTNEQLAAAFVSNNVYWTGANGIAGHGGSAVQIYAPSPYESGSSMSHLAFSVDPALSLLMYPSDAASLPLAYSYSSTEFGMWRDMGYDVVPEPSTYLSLLFAGGVIFLLRTVRHRRHSRRAP